MTRKAIPVVILAGFLGSGKTTLLNHLLTQSRGTRIGVVVNDFGAIEIDALTVAGQVDSMVSLGDGCLCCAVDASELDGYLDRLARPELAIDVIVVEASGLAEPQELVRMVLAGENPRVGYGGLVEVVDAAEFEATRARHPETDRHLAVADLVVLNKTDRTEPAERERILGVLAGLSPGTPVVAASHGRVDPDVLFDRRPGARTVGQLSFDDLRAEESGEGTAAGDAGHDDHLHAAYDSVEFVSAEPLDPRRLMAFLDERPEGLYRIKGFADFGAADPDHRYALHAVGRFLRFTPEPWQPDERRLTQLVLIGAGTDRDALLKELTACRNPAPQDAPADEHGMWGVLRYVRDVAETP